VKIVVEAVAEPAHEAVEFLFAGVRKGRVPDIVSERERLGEILVQRQRDRHCPGDLSDFNGVGETVAEMVGETRAEDLGLAFHPAEGAGVHDAIAIALEFGTVRMGRFRIPPATQFLNRKPKPRGCHLAGIEFVSA
jgi:hypothetical protein